jgi:hypothetical protein
MKRLTVLFALLVTPQAHAGEQGAWDCAPNMRAPDGQQEQLTALEECVRKDNAAAMFLLANRLQDKRAARELLLRAAELEHAESLYQLGLEEKDPHKAAQYMKLSAHALKHRQ